MSPELRNMARKFAKDSIVCQATARLIEQVMTEAHAAFREKIAVAVAAEREACAVVIEKWDTMDVWRSEGAAAIRSRRLSPAETE